MLSLRHLIRALVVSGVAACASSARQIPPPNPAAAACPGYDWAVIDSAWTAASSVYHPCDVDERAIAAPGNPAPKYPEELRTQCVTGQAIVQGVVNADGRVEPETIGVLSASHEPFADAARSVFRRFRFHPALKAGQPVRSLVALPFQFRLQGCEVAPPAVEPR